MAGDVMKRIPIGLKDYKKLNTRYGTKKDLKELVDAAHAKA